MSLATPLTLPELYKLRRSIGDTLLSEAIKLYPGAKIAMLPEVGLEKLESHPVSPAPFYVLYDFKSHGKQPAIQLILTLDNHHSFKVQIMTNGYVSRYALRDNKVVNCESSQGDTTDAMLHKAQWTLGYMINWMKTGWWDPNWDGGITAVGLALSRVMGNDTDS